MDSDGCEMVIGQNGYRTAAMGGQWLQGCRRRLLNGMSSCDGIGMRNDIAHYCSSCDRF